MLRHLIILFIILIIFSSCISKKTINTKPLIPQKKFSNKLSSSKKFHFNWWESFHNRELNKIINEALKKNFNLQIAILKIKEADLLYKKEKTSLFPDISLSGEYLKTRVKNKGFSTISTDKYSLGLSTSYEIDIWGKIRAGIKIARLNKLEQIEAYNSLIITISSEIAKNWANILTINEKKEIIKKQIILTEEKLKILEANYTKNLASINDYILTNQELLNLKRELIRLNSEEKISINEIKLLTGRTSASKFIINTKQKLKIPQVLNIGFPSEVLINRPDVNTSLIKLSKAFANVKIAKSKALPEFIFNSNFSYNSSKISSIFNNWVFNLALNLIYPLIDYKKKDINKKIANIQKNEAFLNYKNTVYNAIKEVENAFINIKKSKKILNTIVMQIENQKKHLKNNKIDYLAGKINSLLILSSEISLLNYQKLYIDAKLDYFFNLINLYKACGGKYYEKQ